MATRRLTWPASETPTGGVTKRTAATRAPGGRALERHPTASRAVSPSEGRWYAPDVTPDPTAPAIRAGDDTKIRPLRPLFDAPTVDSPSYRQFLEALGVAVYTTDAAGHITFFSVRLTVRPPVS